MASVRCFIQNCNFPWHKVMHFRTWGTATYRGMWRSSQHLWLRKWKPESFCLREHLSPNPSLCLRTAPSVLSQGHTPVQGRKRHICTEGKLIVLYLNMRNSPTFWPETERKRQGTDHLFLWASMIKTLCDARKHQPERTGSAVQSVENLCRCSVLLRGTNWEAWAELCQGARC